MIALLTIIVCLALAIALAPIILGVIGTMLGLIFTALLYLFAGCPSNTPRPVTPAEQQAQDAPLRQLEDWAKEDAQRAAHSAGKAVKAHAKAAQRKLSRALLDAQARDPESEHGEP